MKFKDLTTQSKINLIITLLCGIALIILSIFLHNFWMFATGVLFIFNFTYMFLLEKYVKMTDDYDKLVDEAIEQNYTLHSYIAKLELEIENLKKENEKTKTKKSTAKENTTKKSTTTSKKSSIKKTTIKKTTTKEKKGDK